MRDFTKEESERYEEALNKLYKPTGRNFFDDIGKKENQMNIYIVIRRQSTYNFGTDERMVKAFKSEESAQQFINKDCISTSENVWFSIEECELVS